MKIGVGKGNIFKGFCYLGFYLSDTSEEDCDVYSL